jgi:hypothetical protein
VKVLQPRQFECLVRSFKCARVERNSRDSAKAVNGQIEPCVDLSGQYTCFGALRPAQQLGLLVE